MVKLDPYRFEADRFFDSKFLPVTLIIISGKKPSQKAVSYYIDVSNLRQYISKRYRQPKKAKKTSNPSSIAKKACNCTKTSHHNMPSRFRHDRKYTAPAHNHEPPMPPVSVANDGPSPPGPHPSFIQVANPYIFEATVKECLEAVGTNPSREDTTRIQGVTWLDNVRKALQLYVSTTDLSLRNPVRQRGLINHLCSI